MVRRGTDFGLYGDGSDETAGFLRMRAHLIANPGTEVVLQAGDYKYKNQLWLRRVKYATITAYGCTFENTNANWIFDGDRDAFALNPDFFSTSGLDHPIQGGDALPSITPTKLQTVAAGASAVQLITPSERTRFAPGCRAFVYGWAQQFGGYPPSPRYHEIVEVTAVSTDGLLSLRDPLRHNYRADWYLDPEGGNLSGPAMIIPLDRPDFTLAEHIEIAGAHFLGNATIDGARSIRLKDCTMENLVVSMVGAAEFERCRIGGIEVDKCGDLARFTDCDVWLHGGGTGFDRYEILGGRTRDTIAIDGGAYASVVIERHDFYGTGQVRAGGGAVELRDVRVHRRPGDTDALCSAGGEEIALPAATAVSATTITIPLTITSGQNELYYLAEGQRLFTGVRNGAAGAGEQNSGVVSLVTSESDGAGGYNAVITANFRKTPTVGDMFRLQPTRYLRRDIYQVNGSPLTGAEAFGEGRAFIDVSTAESAAVQLRRFALPHNTANHVIPINGYLRKLWVHVAQPATGNVGASADVSLYYAAPGFVSHAVDSSLAGLRELETRTVAGAQGRDGIAPLGFPYVANLNVAVTGANTTFASGFVLAEFMPQYM